MDFLEPQENLVLLAKRGPLVSLVNLAHQVKLVTLGHQVPKENQGKMDPWGLLEKRAREVSLDHLENKDHEGTVENLVKKVRRNRVT